MFVCIICIYFVEIIFFIGLSSYVIVSTLGLSVQQKNELLACYLYLFNVDIEDSDKTGLMLTYVLTGHTGHFLIKVQLICSYHLNSGQK